MSAVGYHFEVCQSRVSTATFDFIGWSGEPSIAQKWWGHAGPSPSGYLMAFYKVWLPDKHGSSEKSLYFGRSLHEILVTLLQAGLSHSRSPYGDHAFQYQDIFVGNYLFSIFWRAIGLPPPQTCCGRRKQWKSPYTTMISEHQQTKNPVFFVRFVFSHCKQCSTP